MYKDIKREKTFRLQIFQHTIAIMCDVPLRILHKKVNFDSDEKISNILTSFHKASSLDDKLDIIKETYNKSVYEKIKNAVWVTRPSYSMPIIRKIKENETMWSLLLLDSIPFNGNVGACSLGFSRYIKMLNQDYDLVIGRILTHPENNDSAIAKQFKTVSDNIIKLDTPRYVVKRLVKKRFSLKQTSIVEKTANLQNIFQLLEPIYKDRETHLSRKELEKIARFAVYIIKNGISAKKYVSISDTHTIEYSSNKLRVINSSNNGSSVTTTYQENRIIAKNNEKMWMSEYINLLKSETHFLKTQESQREIVSKTIKKIINISEADKGCFIKYSTTTGKLEADSIYYTEEDDYWKGIQRIIKELNNSDILDKDIRQKSRALRVVDRYYDLGITYELENEGKDIEQPIENNKKDIQSYMCIAVHYYGKVLGVFFIDSFRSNAFTNKTIEVASELIDMLASDIYSAIFSEHFNHISTIMKDEIEISINKNKIFKNICEHIDKMLFCKGSSIWVNTIQDFSANESLKLYGSTLHEDDIKEIDTRGLLIKNVMNQSEIKIIEDIFQFDITSLQLQPALKEKGVKSLLLAPISDSTGKVLGIVSIYYDRLSIDFDSDKFILKKLSSTLANSINIIKKIENGNLSVSEQAFHEVSKNYKVATNRLNALRDKIAHSFTCNTPEDYENLNVLYKNLDDTYEYTEFGYDYMKYLVYDRDESYIDKKDKNIIKFYRQQLDKHSNVSSNLHLVMTEILLSYEKRMNSKKIRHIYNGKNIYSVNIPAIIPNSVLLNIIDNAVKYAHERTNIEVTYKENLNFFEIYISNIGLKIRDDEITSIFKEEFRGSNLKKDFEDTQQVSLLNTTMTIAKYDKHAENRGFGLYIAKEIAEFWEGEVALDANKKDEYLQGYKNVFVVRIPTDIINIRR